MIKKILLLTTLATSIILNADYLKTDEFDLNKLGKVFENYIQKTDKKFYDYDNKIIANQHQIKKLSDKVANLEKKLEQFNQKELTKSVTYTKNMEDIDTSNTRVVTSKKGIISYSEPFSLEDLYLKRYSYGTKLEVESCDQYGWCKLKNNKEYVAGYLLSGNEND